MFHLSAPSPSLTKSVAAVLRNFYPSPRGKNFAPHVNDALLRREILELSYFDDLRARVTELERAGDHAIIVEKMHLDGYAPAERNAFLYAVGLAMGYPTPSQQRSPALLWDVKRKKVPAGQLQTYSEHAAEADLHTDSQFFPFPEPYFVLYAVRSARCGGGVSRFCTAQAVREQLVRTASGAQAYEILSTQDVPFQFYDPFFSDRTHLDGGVDSRVTMARIFGEDSTIRYRRDVIEHGIRTRKESTAQTIREALAELAACLDHRVAVVEYLLADDGLALCNNHRLLHGRSAFEDDQRYLLRMRLGAKPITEQVVAQRRALAGEMC